MRKLIIIKINFIFPVALKVIKIVVTFCKSVEGAVDYSSRRILDMPLSCSQQSHGLLGETN